MSTSLIIMSGIVAIIAIICATAIIVKWMDDK